MSSDNLMIEVKNLDLAFPLKTFTENSFKETFISLVKNPFSVFSEKRSFFALKDICFKAQRGDRIGLLGLNGAGKSTLCRCLSGFYTPPRGEVLLKGKVRALFDPSLSIFPELSGRENVKVLAQIFYDNKTNDIEKIIQESIEFSELGEFIDVPIKAYSKGMLLRLSLSLLSATPADILILDEVFDGADEFFREKLSQRIKKLINESGVVIFVSHQGDQLIEVCNRSLLLNRGKIVFDGPPQESLRIYRQNYSVQKPPTF